MNYLERLEVGYTNEEALYMDRLEMENRMDELEYRQCCCGGLTFKEERELNLLWEFFDNYYKQFNS